jgi:hypothetical protein
VASSLQPRVTFFFGTASFAVALPSFSFAVPLPIFRISHSAIWQVCNFQGRQKSPFSRHGRVFLKPQNIRTHINTDPLLYSSISTAAQNQRAAPCPRLFLRVHGSGAWPHAAGGAHVS